MALLSYALCVITAIACALLLTRGYRHSRSRLLFWSALCFWGLTLTNILGFVDVLLIPGPGQTLYGLRLATGLLSVAVMLFGMVWELR